MSLSEDIGKLTNVWPILLDHFSVKSITDDSIDLSMLALTAHTIDKFNDLLESSIDLESNIKKCINAKSKVLALDPEANTYSIDSYIKEANKVLSIENKFNVVKNNLIFNDVKISKSTGGDLALFGNYKYKGPACSSFALYRPFL